MTLGFLFGSKNFCKLLYVSWEVFCFARIRLDPLSGQVLHTTAYRWLFRDSHSSLRTLWSAVIKSPNCSARGTTVPVSFLQGALVILVLKQMSQFRSFGKLIYIYIVLARYNFSSRLWSWLTKEIAGASLYSGTLSSTRFFVYFLTILADHATVFPVLFHCLHFYLDLGFLLVHATDLSVLFRCHAYSHFSFSCGMLCRNYGFLRYQCGWSKRRWSWRTCRQTRDNEGYVVRCVVIDLPDISDEVWFLTTGPMEILPLIFAQFS